MLIDSHAHINFKEYEAELEDVIRRSLENKTWVINVGSNYESSQKAVEIADKFGLGVFASVGCHPIHLIKDIEEKTTFEGQEQVFQIKQEKFDYDKYYELAGSSDSIVAIGETGFDFFRLADKNHPISEIKEIQTKVFKESIRLAKELNKALILHCRGEAEKGAEAYEMMLDILSQEKEVKGVIHCFGGNLTQALKFIDLGFYIGFTGIVTFKNAKELQNIAKEIPLDKILVETDAPFLAPVPYRGVRNEPTFVRYIVQKIADLKQLTFDKVGSQTFENASRLFKL